MTNFANVQVQDIQHAYDLIVAKLEKDGLTVAREQKANEMLKETLGQNGYTRATAIDAFTKSWDAAKSRGNATVATPATASKGAHAIYTAVTGETLDGAPAANDDAVTAPQAAAPAPTDGLALDTGTVDLPEFIEQLQDGNDALKSVINSSLAAATGGKFKSIDVVIRGFVDAAAYIEKIGVITTAAKAKLALLENKEFDEAAAIDVPVIEAFQVSGISTAKIGAAEALTINNILKGLGIDDGITFEVMQKKLKKIEDQANKANKALREENSKIRKATPKSKLKGDATEGLPPFSIVTKTATEIFADKSFGPSKDLLEFDVPTLDWDGETPSEVPTVDPTYRFMDSIVANALDAIADNVRPWMLGESGCGKSEFWEQIAARLNMPFTRINLDAGITRSDIVGRTALVPNANETATITKFVEGILTRAMKMPGIIMFDEFDCGDPEIMPVLQPVLEGRGLRILEDGGRLVNPHPLCRIVVTANTNGMGSENGAYSNVNEQSAATRNRYTKWIRMPYLPESQEISVVLERNPSADPEFVKKMVQFANTARQAYSMNTSSHIISTRNVLEAARMYAKFLPLLKDADKTRDWVLQTTIYEAADEKSANTLKEQAKQIFV